MKKILLTNDDGYSSKGLIALKEALQDLAQIYIIAPSSEKSACAHSITQTRALKFIKISENFYKLDDGTPSDCVYLGLYEFFKTTKPDLIISGINLGANMGEDITYSGTVAAAMEGVLQGVPSIAISQKYENSPDFFKNFDFQVAKNTIFNVVQKIFQKGFPLQNRTLLNINIPINLNPKGIMITNAGERTYKNEAFSFINPKNEKCFWLGMPQLDWMQNSTTCDLYAVEQGYISITPIKLDMSDYSQMKRLEEWI